MRDGQLPGHLPAPQHTHILFILCNSCSSSGPIVPGVGGVAPLLHPSHTLVREQPTQRQGVVQRMAHNMYYVYSLRGCGIGGIDKRALVYPFMRISGLSLTQGDIGQHKPLYSID